VIVTRPPGRVRAAGRGRPELTPESDHDSKPDSELPESGCHGIWNLKVASWYIPLLDGIYHAAIGIYHIVYTIWYIS
jgi:hypothetical protein